MFRSAGLSRVHHGRRIANGFLQTATKSWWNASLPGATVFRFASSWDVCASYCSTRFGNAWDLFAEQSLLPHAERTSIPPRIGFGAPDGSNNGMDFLLGTSLDDLRTRCVPPAADCCERNGVRFLKLEPVLIRITAAFIAHSPVDARIVLASVPNPEDVPRRLLDGGHSAIAGRLAGAFL